MPRPWLLLCVSLHGVAAIEYDFPSWKHGPSTTASPRPTPTIDMTASSPRGRFGAAFPSWLA
eukprot:CAMPEP_0185412034 /NCGR_PEP_ID=MMETSP1365-20130426/3949_1 /TAXON_ID=38817 /ORGANISM="Gephyrocapsa oceanica, Strain RCC1303" /LENGTH=61 /DNA_ID=CAMNT_0028014701 /DNA_START=43 /DNA_END=225 /DNA_ORIENTATION=+